MNESHAELIAEIADLRAKNEMLEQARNIYADAKDGMAEWGTKQQLRADSLARDLAAVHQRNECLKHDAETDRAMCQKHMARAERSEAERDALLHEFRECRTCNLGGDLCERSNRLEKERDNLAQRVADLTEQLTAYAVQYGNAALSQPKPASKEKEK